MRHSQHCVDLVYTLCKPLSSQGLLLGAHNNMLVLILNDMQHANHHSCTISLLPWVLKRADQP